MRKSVKRKTACIAAVFLVILASITGLYFVKIQDREENHSYREQILELNEIEKLTEIDGKSPAKEQISNMQENLRQMEGEGQKEEEQKMVLQIFGICALFIACVCIYLYIVMLRPFEELEKYATEIAKGNLEVELPYHRTNLFGAFTWAFDHMRREIIKARACEKEAIENNKTVIATLSHDIKTPIASIRAYAEGLEANMDRSPERRNRYLSVIMKKCDEVTKLTNDLFLHSLSDLEKLQITSEEIALKPFLKEVLEGMGQQEKITSETEKIQMIGEISQINIWADRKRLGQVLENLITNARKYAPGTPIRLWIEQEENQCQIHVKDGGKGIPPEDVPFVFEKFYRGKNIENQPGAGLGLYIVSYIMEQMDGKVELKNGSDGLEVILFLKTS
ncbi:HAMP domain-containing sensor histidine kinase [Roseburia sp. MSJ-14]|uniref:HAMP domain-containing sensor histidine kinase n=1 Tax=Roseburia sp. MSJ-14 TaxID=2841514 RepID=UPI001C116478|nr:HAMP domain-containing sensor histidine kinase [Roseburia sp. MSJ-14]MBU5473391.1 HAMP domain-containing histidine kinase [Roseburia sp. MSJ-14]